MAELINGGDRLEDVLRELSNGDYVVADGATDWDPIDLMNSLENDALDTEVYCEMDESQGDGYAGYIARYDEAGYIQSSPALYTIKRA